MPKVSPRGAQFRVPLWLFVLALIPVGVFFASLLVAAGIAVLALGAFTLLGAIFAGPRPTEPPLAARRSEEDRRGAIELDPSDYRRLPDTGEREQ